MYEWVIIGGGIEGMTLAAYLMKTGKTKVDELAVVDRNAEPLANWKQEVRKSSRCHIYVPHLSTI